MESKDFYKAFEDAYRGSRDVIKQRVSVYLPFVTHLKEVYPRGLALDIGCGRGEWLELLKENGVGAKGIDLDKGMLSSCKDIGLDAIYGNGIEYLKQQDDESHMLITTFHVVEHIPFEDLQSLVAESLRVLKPGGLLVMETPNPENIKVATEHFYLDPTHAKPIPSMLLSFLPGVYGFARTKVLRLQENEGLTTKANVSLQDVLEGCSLDYATVSQKSGKLATMERFDTLFEKDVGLPLSYLTEKFEARLIDLERKVEVASSQLDRIKNSKLYKCMKFLELIKNRTKEFLSFLARLSKQTPFSKLRGGRMWIVFEKLIIKVKNYINTKPRLKSMIVNYFPGVKAKVHRLQGATSVKELGSFRMMDEINVAIHEHESQKGVIYVPHDKRR